MTPNPRLPRREMARKGFLEVKKPETSLKRKQLAGKKKRENITGRWANISKGTTELFCVAGVSSLWEGCEGEAGEPQTS